MVEDKTFTDVAKSDFKIRLVSGFIFGILVAIVSLVFVVISFIAKNYELAVALIVMVLVGSGVSASCGYFLFRKENKEEKEDL